jgi:hypothetical protein
MSITVGLKQVAPQERHACIDVLCRGTRGSVLMVCNCCGICVNASGEKENPF